ncbi:MAG: hypothetical protein RMH84_04930, partial [Sulfolobales archaeon]|nr:hypothetical protein [Sulfolobales archaeon]
LAESYVEEVVESALGVARAAVYVAPVVEVVQYVLIGAIFGLVKGVFRERLGFGELTSAAAAGVLHILLLGAIPVLVISTLYAEILGVVSKYINLYLAAAAPGAVFAVSIVLVSSVRGPWTKLVEAKPREV